MDWIEEVEKQDSAFRWIHHFIVEYENKPIGFCQYYACKTEMNFGEDTQKWTALIASII